MSLSFLLSQALLFFLRQLLGLENDDKLLECSSKGKRHFAYIVFDNGRSRVLPHIEGFIKREPHSDSLGNLALGNLLPVDKQHTRRTLAVSAAVVPEGDP